VIDSLEQNLNSARVELETDKALLKEHQEILAKERAVTEQIRQ
jgi:hypothetical protein